MGTDKNRCDRSFRRADYPNRKPAWQKERGYAARQRDDWLTVQGRFPDKDMTLGTVRFLRMSGFTVKVEPDGTGYRVRYRRRRR
jgi:hypothetical protein